MSDDPHKLHESVEPQLEALTLDPGRPLIISDADEVLLQFVAGLERYIETKGFWLDLKSFALTGNIRDREKNQPLEPKQVGELIASFFADASHHLEPVDRAAEHLANLAPRAQIVVLSNLPVHLRDSRAALLERHGMPYPVIANTGLKGAAIRHMAQRIDPPVFFLDDLPHNIASAARAHEPVHRLHFIADQRLAALLEPAPDSHFFGSDWVKAHDYIDRVLSEAGF